ncbi:unnamed protein product [Trichobilharzia regenti]|nr:unnamed protein product [Trichobilharzia regenti]
MVQKMSSTAEPKLSKLDHRLQAAISGRRFYEAHQLYKTIHFRCIMRKNYQEALKYLKSGSEFLLDNEQWESGTELACLVLDVYSQSGSLLTESHLAEVCELLIRMTPGEERMRFISKALQLLQKQKDLLASFNGYLARVLWQEGSFSEARLRIMLSSNGYAAGSFLVALHQRYGLRSEIDLFIAQAVLQFLCMKQTTVAIITFYTYTRGHPRLEPGPPFTHFPLLNFLWFLMLAIEKKCSLAVFSVLCEKYSPQLNRDSSYVKYLDKIGQLYFDDSMLNEGSSCYAALNNINDVNSSPDEMCFEDVD